MSKKNDTDIQNIFPKCVCGEAVLQIGRGLPGFGRFLPKKQKASSKERWVHTHIHFWNAV